MVVLMMKFLNNRLCIILFFNMVLYSVALSGPLDIKKIQKECLSIYKTESSIKYTKCLKDKVNKILNNENKNK